MKTWLIYLFTFLYITTSTQLCQMYKTPVFISHFFEHENGGDFIQEMKDFLIVHYGGHDKDDDWETDQKLPFMKVEISHIDLAALPKIIFISPIICKEKIEITFVYYDESNLYSHYLNTIWQPPKHA